MPLRDYGQFLLILRRWWWLPLILGMIGGAGGYGYTKTQPKIYRATVVVEGTPTKIDSATAGVLDNLYPRYNVLLTSLTFAQELANRTQTDLPADLIRSELHPRPDPTNKTITIDVEDTSRDRALVLADATAAQFIVDEAIDAQTLPPTNMRVYFQQVDPAVAGTDAVKPLARYNSLVGAASGLLIGLFLALALDFYLARRTGRPWLVFSFGTRTLFPAKQPAREPSEETEGKDTPDELSEEKRELRTPVGNKVK